MRLPENYWAAIDAAAEKNRRTQDLQIEVFLAPAIEDATLEGERGEIIRKVSPPSPLAPKELGQRKGGR